MVPPEELEEYPRPKLRRFFLLPVAIAIGIAALVAVLQPAEKPAPQELPSFELTLLGGGTFSSEEIEGKPVVVNMWASWCGPCREEAPALERLWRRHRAHGLVVLGLNTRDQEEAAGAFVDEFGITYPIVRDPEQELVGRLEDISGIVGLPQTFFVRPDGVLAGSVSGNEIGSEGSTVVLGAMSEEQLEAEVQNLLNASDSPQP